MSIDRDPVVFKLLVGIIGGIIVGLGSLLVTAIFFFKKNYNATVREIFHRIGKAEKNIAERGATCDERHRRKK